MSFKIIAIRPLENCSQRFLKNLTKNEIYQFYNDYEFLVDKQKRVKEVRYNSSIPKTFFNVDRYKKEFVTSKKKNIPIAISICAVVGENGSGKSAISELFLASLFIISNKVGFVTKENFLDIYEPTEQIRYDSDIPELEKGIATEIYYQVEDFLYKLKVEANEISHEVANFENHKFVFSGDINFVTQKNEIPTFFYSMIVNYSFYAFNSNDIGMWIKAFFHKNDGYQMPIVINPYRNKGKMDINTETYLTGSRVLANILSIKNYKNINSKSAIDKVGLYFDDRKDYRFLKDGSARFSSSFIKEFREKIIIPLYNLMFSNEFQYPEINKEIEAYAEIYLIQKLINIPTKYDSFSKFERKKRKSDSNDNYKFTSTNAKKYVEELYRDRSHITLKVRQVLNFLRKNIFNLTDTNFAAKLDLQSIVKAMEENVNKNWFTEIIDYLPPPFLVSRILFKDGSYFADLSSGEKQKIYSLNSIIYHLKNIDSVHKNRQLNEQRGIIEYENINLIFDEIELYYHPDFQKKIVRELLDFIKDANYEYIKNINMIFLTHAPFILSDIPNQNIMYLKLGKSLVGKDRPQKSFGANITDLLADSFFIEDGLIGNFAKEKISLTLNWLKIKANEYYASIEEKEPFQIDNKIRILKFVNVKDEVKYHREVIEMIDEPLVKNKLISMFIDYVSEDTFFLDAEIKKAEQRLELLKIKKDA